ncbi:MAG: DNA methyltransferase [Candidatus Sumerlaeota bacterium]|nr:DNA methyltransferase [Candidatus Sumerlaeota bacterium]
MNRLLFGDNLKWLQNTSVFPDSCVDLVYLDPPFNSNADYNVLFREASGEASQAQFHAFTDTWSWADAAETYNQFLDTCSNIEVVELLRALHSFLKSSPMMAYLAMMAPRLVELRRVLKPAGSLYLHCDPTASHYLRVVLDGVFGAENFRNEIIWRRTGSHNSSKRYGPIHDTILFYSKSSEYYFRRAYRPYLKGHVENYFKKQDEKGRYWTNTITGAGKRKGESGRIWRDYDPTAASRHWAIPSKVIGELGIDPSLSLLEKLDALDEAGAICHPPDGSNALPTYRQYLHLSPGMPLQDLWTYQPHTRGVLWNSDEAIDEDVRWLVAQGDPERLGYPTQKPLGLLTRVIESSSKPGGIVLDPFCGCGTTIHAAQKLGRQWMGIDITYLAINLIKRRLRDAFGQEVQFEERGQPTDFASARRLAELDKFQFQHWALSLADARPVKQAEGRGADRGVDGLIYFYEGKTERGKIIVQVKGGGVKRNDISTLLGDVNNQNAAAGVLITLENPTKPMRMEAAEAGRYVPKLYSSKNYPRIQILTIEGLLAGTERLDAPPQFNLFAKAEREVPDAMQGELL